MKNGQAVYQRLCDIVGSGFVEKDPYHLEVYSREVIGTQSEVGFGDRYPRPDFVVLPNSVKQVQKILAVANEYKVPVIPASGYSSTYGEAVPLFGGILMHFRRWKGIQIDEDSMHVSFEGGTTLGDAWQSLTPRGLQIAWPAPTPMTSIIALFTQRGSGMNCGDEGFLCEQVVGLDVVLPTGELVTTGSGAKPGVGQWCRYIWGPDLTGLFLGAQGTLGVITKVTTTMSKIPEAHYTVRGGFKSLKEVALAIKKLGEVDIGEKTLGADLRHHIELSAIGPADAAYIEMQEKESKKMGLGAFLHIFMSGTRERVTQNRQITERIFKSLGGVVLDPAKFKDHLSFKNIEPVNGFIQPYGPRDDGHKMWKICQGGRLPVHSQMPWGMDVLKYLEDAERIGAPYRKVSPGMSINFGFSGNKRGRFYSVFLHCFHNSADPKQAKAANELALKWIDLTFKKYRCGIYRPTRYIGDIVMRQTGEYFKLFKRLKEDLDPNWIMSPGRLGLSRKP